jgi:hypothetical protein
MGALLWFTIAVGFAAAFLHVRVRSRTRSAGGFIRLILAGGACFFLLCGLLEVSVQREFKPENVPIRVDLLFTVPAACVLLLAGLIAYIYGLRSPKLASKAESPLPDTKRAEQGRGEARDPATADERLAHLLGKHSNEQEN